MFAHHRLQRALYHHQWTSVHEWVQSLNELASLSDEEIGQLADDQPHDDVHGTS